MVCKYRGIKFKVQMKIVFFLSPEQVFLESNTEKEMGNWK